jgi:hypothetical protein
MRIVCVFILASALCVSGFFIASSSVDAEQRTRAELLLLYVQTVPDETVAQRLGQLLALVPSGAQAQTKATMRQDLADVLATRKARAQEGCVAPMEQAETDLGDSTFD